jgi:NAD(P)-dependent dehydrogenase (short-subunit alcohol dehydrogenase family)
MDLNLEGRTALVTGGSKGIGLAIARALAAEGVTVVAGARTSSHELEDLTERASVHAVEVDLGSPDGPARLVDEAVGRLGRLNILVNNVGAAHPRPGGFLEVTDDEWLDTLTINFLAAVRTTRAALPHLLGAAPAAIVTTASVNAMLPDPLVIDYSAAKGALANFNKSLAKELGPRGVRVNAVSPGPVSTDLWLGDGGMAKTLAQAGGDAPEAISARAAADSPTGRFTTPDEVAALVVLLASDRTNNVTGADYIIDGGLITTL